MAEGTGCSWPAGLVLPCVSTIDGETGREEPSGEEPSGEEQRRERRYDPAGGLVLDLRREAPADPLLSGSVQLSPVVLAIAAPQLGWLSAVQASLGAAAKWRQETHPLTFISSADPLCRISATRS